jgi:DNA-binding NarL/FixJ family response regulator
MPEVSRRISVLVVDDHPMVRQGVCAFLALQSDLDVVGQAGTSAEALTLAEKARPDVILLDLLLPDRDGIETTLILRATCPNSKILILSSFHEPSHVRRAIDAGITGYLLKDLEAEELVAAIRRAARGEPTLGSQVAAQLMRSPVADPPVEPFHDLSARELEVLRLIAEGLNNAAIADRLFIGEKTVKTHVSSLLAKLGLSDRTQAAAFAWRKGLVSRKQG